MGAPVSEEELFCLALQSPLALFDLGVGLVHHQTHSGGLGEVGLGPVGCACPHGENVNYGQLREWLRQEGGGMTD